MAGFTKDLEYEDIEIDQMFFIYTERDACGEPLCERWTTVKPPTGPLGEKSEGDMGKRIYHIIAKFTPPNHKERVFFQNTYKHPDGTKYRSPKLKCVTIDTFNKYTRAALSKAKGE